MRKGRAMNIQANIRANLRTLGRSSARRAAFAATLAAALLAAAAAPTLHAQGSRKDDIVFGPDGHPVSGATVRVCQPTATGTPCTPLAAIYTDATLSVASANPFQTDGIGNYHFYAAAGRYQITDFQPADQRNDHAAGRNTSRGSFLLELRQQYFRVRIDARRKPGRGGQRDGQRHADRFRFQPRHAHANYAECNRELYSCGAAALYRRDVSRSLARLPTAARNRPVAQSARARIT